MKPATLQRDFFTRDKATSRRRNGAIREPFSSIRTPTTQQTILPTFSPRKGHELDVALRWAQAAKKNQPERPAIADTLGWLYYKLGNYVLARDQLQFAVSKTPDHPVLQYHLAMTYLKTNQVAEAQRALERELHSREDFKEKAQVQAALAEIKR